MSLITRCPACETLFRVVPDQLRISEGWVRCGQCGEIFDASQQLQGMPPASSTTPTPVPAPSPVPVPDDPPSPSGTPAAWATEDAAPASDAPMAEGASSSESVAAPTPRLPHPQPLPSSPDGFVDTLVAAEEPSPARVDAPAAPADAAAPEAEGLVTEPASDDAETAPVSQETAPVGAAMPVDEASPGIDATAHAAADSGELPPAPGPLAEAEPVPPPSEAPQVLEAGDASAETEVPASRPAFPSLRLPPEPMEIAPSGTPPLADPPLSFMRPPRAEASVWQRPAMRGTLGTLAGVLLLTLLLQVLLHQRDRIAAQAPDAQPLLAALCGWMGCTVSPLRQIESIVIDGSSFGRIRDNQYRLTLGIRNTAALPLQMPALELSLTNSQAQTLSRRVIQTRDFPGAPAVLQPGAEWNGSLTLRVAPAAGAQDVAGYGLFAFYP